MRSVFVSAIVLGALAISSTARADIPPPDGQKRVGFEFTVRGLAATPDRIVFAYPCGPLSSGSPVDEHSLVEEGKPVSVGYRSGAGSPGGACNLYTVSKSVYDEWKKTYEQQYKGDDPKLKELTGKALKCTGRPTPSFVLKSDDARSKIEEVLDVKTLTDTSCEIVSTNAQPTNNDPSTPATDSTSPAASDDGGCSVGGGARGAGPWLLALGVPVIVFLTSRRRKNEKKK